MPRTDPPEIDARLALWGKAYRQVLQTFVPLIHEELQTVVRPQLTGEPRA